MSVWTVVPYCEECDEEWEQEIEMERGDYSYVAVCPQCNREYEKEFNVEDYLY